MSDGCWRHRLLNFPACGQEAEALTLFPAETAAPEPARPEPIRCRPCAAVLAKAQSRAEAKNRLAAGPDNALLLQENPAYKELLWKHRFGPVEPETPEVLAAYQQANLRAAEALDTALYVMGQEPKAAQKYARRAYAEYLEDYANSPEHF